MTYFKVPAGILASANIRICSLFEQHFSDISANVLKCLILLLVLEERKTKGAKNLND